MEPWKAAPWRPWAPACPDLGGLVGMGLAEEAKGWGGELGDSFLGLSQFWVSQNILPHHSLWPG